MYFLWGSKKENTDILYLGPNRIRRNSQTDTFTKNELGLESYQVTGPVP